MLEKAEAAKKKNNEQTGNLPSFSILNTVDNNHQENLASDSSIKLGDIAEKIASTISTLQANEIAKASILSAKRKMAEQANQKKKECENAERNREEIETDVEMDRGTEIEGDCPRPSRKPPRRKQTAKAKKVEEEGQKKKSK
jgi:hypothetical protein